MNRKLKTSRVATRREAAMRFVETRLAMTLIELMVVIVILVTLVAGVLPLVSPNNDARKIADAARSLQTYFNQAQAEAQRLGRPVGVGFRESAPGSGVALEAFQLAVPKPFAGLDPNARVRILFPVGLYGDEEPSVRNDLQFLNLYDGERLFRLQFVREPVKLNNDGQPEYDRDPYPDGVFKIGDVINLEGNEFLIVDDGFNRAKLDNSKVSQTDENDDYRLDGYLYDPLRGEVHCIWINNFGQQPPKFKNTDLDAPSGPGDARTYRVHRQPATGNKFGPSPEAVYQLPTGIAIDLQASGVEGLGMPETFAENREVDSNNINYNPPKTAYQKQIGIMFSPHGGVDGVWVNDQAVAGSAIARSGNKLTDVSRIFIMLGRVENQNPPADTYTVVKQSGTVARDYSDDEIREIRSKVNWLNADSRWLMINTQNGRIEVAQNQIFDPTQTAYYDSAFDMNNQLRDDLGGWSEACKIAQIEAAHGDAHGHHDGN